MNTPKKAKVKPTMSQRVRLESAAGPTTRKTGTAPKKTTTARVMPSKVAARGIPTIDKIGGGPR